MRAGGPASPHRGVHRRRRRRGGDRALRRTERRPVHRHGDARRGRRASLGIRERRAQGAGGRHRADAGGPALYRPQRPGEPAAIRKILVPLDGSDLAREALPVVKDLTKPLGAAVTLARIASIPTGMYLDSPYAPMTVQPYLT